MSSCVPDAHLDADFKCLPTWQKFIRKCCFCLQVSTINCPFNLIFTIKTIISVASRQDLGVLRGPDHSGARERGRGTSGQRPLGWGPPLRAAVGSVALPQGAAHRQGSSGGQCSIHLGDIPIISFFIHD